MKLLLIDSDILARFISSAVDMAHVAIDDPELPDAIREEWIDCAEEMAVHYRNAAVDPGETPTWDLCPRCKTPLGFYRWCSICLVHDTRAA